MGGVAHVSTTSRRRVIRLVTVVATAILVGVLGVRFVADRIAPECQWSNAQRAAVAAAPVDEFAGMSLGAQSAVCNMSTPSVLYATYRLPEGSALPSDWYERDAVGTWNVAFRLPGRTMACYVSTDPDFLGVAVEVRSSGTIEALMRTSRGPCMYAAA